MSPKEDESSVFVVLEPVGLAWRCYTAPRIEGALSWLDSLTMDCRTKMERVVHSVDENMGANGRRT